MRRPRRSSLVSVVRWCTGHLKERSFKGEDHRAGRGKFTGREQRRAAAVSVVGMAAHPMIKRRTEGRGLRQTEPTHGRRCCWLRLRLLLRLRLHFRLRFWLWLRLRFGHEAFKPRQRRNCIPKLRECAMLREDEVHRRLDLLVAHTPPPQAEDNVRFPNVLIC